MMKNLVLILVAISFMAVSCKKDEAATPDHLKGLLKKIVYDDGDIVDFEYDDQKRLIKETETDSDDDLTIINYEYDQNGKVVKISFSDREETYGVDKYEWVGNKVTKTPSDKNDDGIFVDGSPQVYEFDESGKLIKYEQYVDHGSGDELSYYVGYSWVNGNITNGTIYNASGEETGTETYEYGSKSNITPYSNVDFSPKSVSSNNIIKRVINGTGYDSETRYSYVYSEGSTLPESIIETDFFNGSQSDVYSYTCEYY